MEMNGQPCATAALLSRQEVRVSSGHETRWASETGCR
jgi:hypothetical protein